MPAPKIGAGLGLAAILKNLIKNKPKTEEQTEVQSTEAEQASSSTIAVATDVVDGAIDSEIVKAPEEPVSDNCERIKDSYFKVTEEQLNQFKNREKIEYNLENLPKKEVQSISTTFKSTSKRLIFNNNYVRSCKWSNSGNYLMTNSADHITRIFNYENNKINEENIKNYYQGGIVYDQKWHPTLDIFATTSKSHPIKLLTTDLIEVGAPRCINHLDEFDSAYSLSFSNDGTLLFAGYKSLIYIFDLISMKQRENKIYTFATNKNLNGKRKIIDGQKAMITSIMMNPVDDNELICGTYNSAIGICDIRSEKMDIIKIDEGKNVSHMKYSNDGNRIYFSCLNSESINCVDIRYIHGKCLTIANYERKNDTNQKIYFDIDSNEKYLFTGTTNNEILIYEINKRENNPIILKTNEFRVTAGLNLHPTEPILATTHGERVFPDPEKLTEDFNDTSVNFGLKLWSF